MKIYFLLSILLISETTAMQKKPLAAHIVQQTYGTANQPNAQQTVIYLPATVPITSINQPKRTNYTQKISQLFDDCTNSQLCIKGTAWAGGLILAAVFVTVTMVAFNLYKRANPSPK